MEPDWSSRQDDSFIASVASELLLVISFDASCDIVSLEHNPLLGHCTFPCLFITCMMDTTDKIVKLNCFNPFKKSNHSHARKGLRNVTPWMHDLIPGTPKLSKVCDCCRKQLTKLKNEKHREISTGSSKIHEESQSDTEIQEEPIYIPFTNESEALCSLNSSFRYGRVACGQKEDVIQNLFCWEGQKN